MFGRVDRHFVRSGHPYRWVVEHAHHIFNRIFMRDGITTFQDADIFLSVSQENVNGAGLALTSFLNKELKAWFLRHIRFDDLDRAIGAAGGHNDNFRYFNLVKALGRHGFDNFADIGFFVVSRDAYTTFNCGL